MASSFYQACAVFVVYFNQLLGAVHTKPWSKYAYQKAKKEQKSKKFVAKFSKKHFFQVCTKMLVKCFLYKMFKKMLFCCKFLAFFSFYKLSAVKNIKNAYFHQCLGCAAPKNAERNIQQVLTDKLKLEVVNPGIAT